MAVHPMAERRVLYEVAHPMPFRVDLDLTFPTAGGAEVPFDLYRPDPDGLAAVVVMVNGYPDPGMARAMGAPFRRLGWSQSWAGFCAASGLAAVVPSNVEPAADLAALLGHLRTHGHALGLDGGRVGVLASSGHGPLALSRLAADQPRPRCAALLYPYLMDLDELTVVAEASATFKFVAPLAGRTLDALDLSVPMLVARAGADEMPGLNAGLDRFVTRASAAGAALALVDVPRAPHAFDLTVPGEGTSRTVEAVIRFLRDRLTE